MLIQTPALSELELSALSKIEELRTALSRQVYEPRRWTGSLRRMTFARNIQGSNSIEGFVAALDDTDAVALREEPLDTANETRMALEGYRNAMTYILQLAQEPHFRVSSDTIKSLHFMMTGYDLANYPGRWRPGAIYVHNESTQEIVYEGADVEEVPTLMEELSENLNFSENEHPIIRGAMAHLNLVMIHPFRDGNGRMSRGVQSMVMAQEGVLAPVFMSIEEYLSQHTQEYYDVLNRVGGRRWNPESNARPWIRFVLQAHNDQAHQMQYRYREAEFVWSRLERIQEKAGIPERTISVLFDACFGYRIRHSTYKATVAESGEVISDQTASRDLTKLAAESLLLSRGEKRGRFYVAGNLITSIRKEFRDSRKESGEDKLFPDFFGN